MKKTKIALLSALIVSSSLLTGCIVVVDAADKGNSSYQSASAAQGGDISRVNGSINISDNSQMQELSTVNGSIKLGNNVRVRSADTVNGSIKAASGLQVQQGLSTVNGSIELSKGTQVGANVTTVNGGIRLDNTLVTGELSTVNGSISLKNSSQVKGDIVFAERKKSRSWFGKDQDEKNQPKLYISADSVVEGKIILRQPVQLQLENTSLAARVVKEY